MKWNEALELTEEQKSALTKNPTALVKEIKQDDGDITIVIRTLGDDITAPVTKDAIEEVKKFITDGLIKVGGVFDYKASLKSEPLKKTGKSPMGDASYSAPKFNTIKM